MSNRNKRGPLSKESLEKLRRLRKARREQKNFPLFAFAEMQSEFCEYSEGDFAEDLRRRSKPKKKRAKKNPLLKFGRYRKIQALLVEFDRTHDFSLIERANKLRPLIRQYYRVKIRKGDHACEYFYAPECDYDKIAVLCNKMGKCATWEEVDALDKAFSQYSHIS